MWILIYAIQAMTYSVIKTSGMHLWWILLCYLFFTVKAVDGKNLPIVINTWQFTEATDAAWQQIHYSNASVVDAVVVGCATCERLQCDGTVGYGGSPDEHGETTLDAMVMDGTRHDVGAVAGLRRVKDAIAVARAVLEHTSHTLLVGELATRFAIEMGFKEVSLQTNVSLAQWKQWHQRQCQPNFWQNVSPDPRTYCGPYHMSSSNPADVIRYSQYTSEHNHDTIGMLVVDSSGHIAAGTSTNGVIHKIPGRVGDSPVAGAGAYVDRTVGGATATGDGDVMMRFLPSFHAVELMKSGYPPTKACATVVAKIQQFYPEFSGAVVAVTTSGRYGAACHGFKWFPYSVRTADTGKTKVYKVKCSR